MRQCEDIKDDKQCDQESKWLHASGRYLCDDHLPKKIPSPDLLDMVKFVHGLINERSGSLTLIKNIDRVAGHIPD